MLVNILQNTISSFRSASSAIITNGLKMWLGFKTISISGANQITPDLSGNSNVGKLYTGKALDFNGSTDSVDIDGFQLAGSDATFAFWINPVFTTGVRPIFDVNPTRLRFRISSGNLEVLSGSTVTFGSIASNQWQRVVIVINGTSADAYINGVQSGVTQTITAIDISTATLARIAANYTGIGTLDGKLSDFQIYNAVWSADDIAYDYAKPNHLVTDNSSTSLTVSNLKGYWALNEGAGSTAYDSSGEGINGTINGATYTEHEPKILQLGMVDYSISTPVSDEVTLVANPSNPSQDILGTSVRLREHSFNLDGSGWAEVDDADDLDFGTGAFTMECWVKADFVNTGSSQNIIFTLGGEYNDADSASIITDSTKFSCRVSTKNLIADNNYTIGDWYHVCVTRDGSNLCTLYIDAEAQLDTETTSASITNTSTKLIGRDTLTTRFYKNLISDVRLYKGKALSASEIENNYNVGLPAHSAGSSFSDDFSGDYGN